MQNCRPRLCPASPPVCLSLLSSWSMWSTPIHYQESVEVQMLLETFPGGSFLLSSSTESWTTSNSKPRIWQVHSTNATQLCTEFIRLASQLPLFHFQEPYQFCNWSRQALGGPPIQALCCLRFHSTSSSLIRAFWVSSVIFNNSIILWTTS